ncbi:Gfo/Idh/MocA family oxidoreductase [bacterium]|nr:Gfo/Idh/MocA family oxidoreductase [bacterium]
MGERNLGAAVIGLKMGSGHLRGYASNPKTTVVAICDPDKDLLERRREEYGPRMAVTDYRELLNEPDIHIVSVASPDYFHAEQCVSFLKAGKDVLCEKPLTLGLEEALGIVQAVRETGRRFMVGQVCRYAPGFALAKRLVDRGEIGDLYLVESEYAHSYREARGAGDWRVDPRREPFIGGGCHAVDLLRWVAGDPVEAFAYANHKCLTDWPMNDCTMAVYRFPNEVIGKVMVSVGCVRPYTMRSVFYGTEGTIVCDNQSSSIQMCSRKNFGSEPSFADFPVEIAHHNVTAEIAEFVECISGDKPIPTNELEGARTVAACLAAVESARSGKPERVARIESV